LPSSRIVAASAALSPYRTCTAMPVSRVKRSTSGFTKTSFRPE
jgi:hypothetical protein